MIDFAIATQNPRYVWEPNTRRYRDRSSGKFLSKQAIASTDPEDIQLAVEDWANKVDDKVKNLIGEENGDRSVVS